MRLNSNSTLADEGKLIEQIESQNQQIESVSSLNSYTQKQSVWKKEKNKKELVVLIAKLF
mgnify:FL=1